MTVSTSGNQEEIGHPDAVEKAAMMKTNRSRETVHGIYRFVLEELQTEAHAAANRKMIRLNSHRDLLGQHHLSC